MTDETTPTPPTTDEIKFWVERFIAAAMKGDDVETDAAITWAETTPERSDLFWRAFAERATDEKDSVIAALEAERERLEALSWSTSAPRPVHG